MVFFLKPMSRFQKSPKITSESCFHLISEVAVGDEKTCDLIQ